MLRQITIIIALAILPLIGFATIRVASSNGNWGTASTWSPSGVPTCGDTMVINSGVTVTVTTSFDSDEPSCADQMHIKVMGTLKFSTGKKMYLPCSSFVEIPSGGVLQKGTGGGSSNLIDICGVTVWKAADGNVSGPITYGTGAPLPVELTDFFAKMIDNFALLEWITASERNNSHFNVERSQDGEIWEYLGHVAGVGTVNTTQTYNYEDYGVDVFRDYYYRLIQIDLNGNKEISPVVMAEGLSGREIPAYEIVIDGREVSVIFNESSDNDVGVLVVDAAGTLISHDRLGKVGKGDFLAFDIPVRDSGWFAIVLQVGTRIQTEKMFFLK
jgi:hypothetical protein